MAWRSCEARTSRGMRADVCPERVLADADAATTPDVQPAPNADVPEAADEAAARVNVVVADDAAAAAADADTAAGYWIAYRQAHRRSARILRAQRSAGIRDASCT